MIIESITKVYFYLQIILIITITNNKLNNNISKNNYYNYQFVNKSQTIIDFKRKICTGDNRIPSSQQLKKYLLTSLYVKSTVYL